MDIPFIFVQMFMMRFFVCLLFTFFIGVVYAQQPVGEVQKKQKTIPENKPTLPDSIKGDDQLPATFYKIITHTLDTLHFDTVQNIHKDRKFNYLRKDNFGLLRFNNMGQTYNTLAPSFSEIKQYPQMGIRAKHFNYKEVEDILYYRVPTPTTELAYKSAFEQGQMLDALFTLNTSPELNLSIAYKGLRSLGKYQNILSSTGNFRTTASYQNKKDSYRARAHFASQDLLNNENGGLDSLSLVEFKQGTEEFLDRSVFSPRFEDANNFLIGKRYYLDHSYSLKRNDSTQTKWFAIDHTFNYETKIYRFEQTAANAYFGDSFQATNIEDRAQLRSLYNEVGIKFYSGVLGIFRGFANFYRYNYFFNQILTLQDGSVIPNNLKGNDTGFGGSWKYRYAGFDIGAKLALSLNDNLGGNYFKAATSYKFNTDTSLKLSVLSGTTSPNFNILLNQSDYRFYNWYNPEFKDQKIQQIGFSIRSKKWFNTWVEYSVLDNYLYFVLDSEATSDLLLTTPQQYVKSINHLSIKLYKNFSYWRFGLDNTIQYQEVTQSDAILNVPKLITRNTFYYTDRLFKRALFMQAGVTFNYFTSYYANGYNPLISEFYVQNEQEIGDFPRLDLFVNMKVRNTRIFFKWEHI